MPEIDLKDYVHVAQYEQLQAAYENAAAELEAATKQIEAANKEREEHGKFKSAAEKAAARLAELEAKVRTRAHRDAVEKLFDEAKVKKDLRDDLFRLADWKAETDEPDEKALKKHFAEVLERRPWAIDQEAAGEPKQRRRLETDEPAGRGAQVTDKIGKFRVTRSQIRDPQWMRRNQDAYAAAARAGEVDLVD